MRERRASTAATAAELPPAKCGVPPAGTVERWCWDFVRSDALATKLAPAPPPDPLAPRSWENAPPVRRIESPGRPAELSVVPRSPRTPANLESATARARLVHTFLHHELQAAELFAWALLAYPETPREFRVGLLRLCREELAHLALYADHLRQLGHAPGDFPVRDWFWERVVTTTDATSFVALLGVGLEGANLEHTTRFAQRFRAAGDADGASILEQVEAEEVGHVAFAIHWFEQWTGAPLEYERWRAALPPPLTPAVLQGKPLNRAARERAGQSADFLARLAAEPGAGGPT